MSTVPTTVTPSAAGPTTPVRTITYRLYGGGSLAVPCPAWCTSTHASDLDGTLHPVDLCHQGDEISLSFTTDCGTTDRIFAARICQYPFSAEGDGSERPHVELLPVEGHGEALGYQTPAEVYTEIRRVREYLLKLRKLADQLAEACV